jgi:hypothetical protein
MPENVKRIQFDKVGFFNLVNQNAERAIASAESGTVPVNVASTVSVGYLVGDIFDIDVRQREGDSTVRMWVQDPSAFRQRANAYRSSIDNTKIRRSISTFLNQMKESEENSLSNAVAEQTRSIRSFFGDDGLTSFDHSNESIIGLGLDSLIELWNELVDRINIVASGALVPVIANSGKFVKYVPQNGSESDTYAFVGQEFVMGGDSVQTRYTVRHSTRNYFGDSSNNSANRLNRLINHLAGAGDENFLLRLYNENCWFLNFEDAKSEAENFLLALYKQLLVYIGNAISNCALAVNEESGVDVNNFIFTSIDESNDSMASERQLQDA